MELAFYIFIAVFAVAAVGLIVKADDFFSRHWDSIYDPRSDYQIWRDRWRERSQTRAESRSGLMTWMSSARSKTMSDLLLNPKLFPTIMIVLSLLSAAVCLLSKDYRRFAYYCASAVLLTSVTY